MKARFTLTALPQKWKTISLSDHQIRWILNFLTASCISLVSLSAVWIVLEYLLTGVRTESAIDTIIAFVASFAIGVFYAWNEDKKETIQDLKKVVLQQQNAIEQQNQILEQQNDTIKKVWAIKKPRQ